MQLNKSLLASSTIALILGALLVLAFAPFDYTYLTFPVIALFIGLLRTVTPQRAFIMGFVFGVGFFGFGASWIYHSIATFGNVTGVFAGVITACFVAYLSLFKAGLSWLWVRFFYPRGLLSLALILPSLWFLAEGLRGWLLTGFPWAYVGYTQLDGLLTGYVPIIGGTGVSWLVVSLCGLTLYMIDTNSIRARLMSLALISVVILTAVLYLNQKAWTEDTQKSLEVAIVQANIPQEKKWRRDYLLTLLQQYSALTRPHWDKDVIVWPENALPLFQDEADGFLSPLTRQAQQTKTALVTGLPLNGSTSAVYYNGIVALGDAAGQYQKHHLVPFGEYVPFYQWLGPMLDWFGLPMSNFSSGEKQQQPLNVKGSKVLPAVCYEIAYVDTIRNRARNADWILTVSNDTWFGDSIGPWQHLQIAQMRARETGRYVARSTNNGVTAIINEQGKTVTQLPQFEAGVLEGQVKVMSGITPFVRWGDWPLLVLSGLLLLFSLIRRLSHPMILERLPPS